MLPMPLVDDDIHRTDRRSATWWPWLLVALGFALLWILFAAVISVVPRMMQSETAPAAKPNLAQQTQADLVRRAQQAANFGAPEMAITTLEGLDPQVPMSLSDKHIYFRVAAESYRAEGKPEKAAQFYDRFLSLSVRIHQPECRSCHTPQTGIAPLRLADMQSSALGKSYVVALTEAGKLKSTRNTLAAQLRKTPDDLRLHLLLYHLETALENTRAARQHSQALRTGSP